MNGHVYDLLIVGGGPAGYTAALYAARAGMDTAVLEKLSAGGQMALTQQIDNFPGFPDGIDGFQLGQLMQRQAERFGAKTQYAEVRRMDLLPQPKVVESSRGTFLGRAVVLATGANPRPLGIEGEDAFINRGIAYCAACDGPFYAGKTVAVVGGGNSAAADALLLSKIAKKVFLIHRRDTLRAARVYNTPLKAAENLEFLWDSVVTQLLGDVRLTGIRVQNTKTGQEVTREVDGLFISIGRQPATDLAKGQLVLDENGYVMADDSTHTNIPGVFAAGDVRAKGLRQVVTAMADGAVAASAAEAYLAGIAR